MQLLQQAKVALASAGSQDVLKQHMWAGGIKHIMPTVVQVADTSDSWEALAFVEHAPAFSNLQLEVSRPQHHSRLTRLQYLIWPHIPAKTAEQLAQKFPKVAVNPKPELCSEQVDPACALDEPLLQAVAPFWEQEQLQVQLASLCMP